MLVLSLCNKYETASKRGFVLDERFVLLLYSLLSFLWRWVAQSCKHLPLDCSCMKLIISWGFHWLNWHIWTGGEYWINNGIHSIHVWHHFLKGCDVKQRFKRLWCKKSDDWKGYDAKMLWFERLWCKQTKMIWKAVMQKKRWFESLWCKKVTWKAMMQNSDDLKGYDTKQWWFKRLWCKTVMIWKAVMQNGNDLEGYECVCVYDAKQWWFERLWCKTVMIWKAMSYDAKQWWFKRLWCKTVMIWKAVMQNGDDLEGYNAKTWWFERLWSMMQKVMI